jgi:hypothetical protein
VSSIQERLRASGIWRGEEPRPAVRSAYGRLARILRDRRVRAIGLVPASDAVAVPPLALGLAGALAAAGAADVAAVDPLGRWSGAPEGGRGAAGAEWYTTEWLAEGVAVISPLTAGAATALPLVDRLVREELARYLHLVVDLTGFDRLGERDAAAALLDGVLAVARCGATRVPEVARALEGVPGTRALGVVLSGA